MTKRDTETREKIIEVTTQLIREHGGTESVTTRDIAACAGVGVGLINYHFQTKEHLLDLCVQKIISRVIDGFDGLYKSLNMSPIDKLRFLAKQNMRFLLANPGISRASILHDIHNPGAGDNTAQTLQAYLPVVREVYGDQADDLQVMASLHTLIFTMQVLYLRTGHIAHSLDYDLANHEQWDRFIDTLIDRLFPST